MKNSPADAATSEKAAVSLQGQDMSVSRAASSDIERAYDRDTGDRISSAGIPSVGNTRGEWAVIGLVRSGNIEDITADGYYLNAVNYINYCSGDSGTPDIADPSDAARIIPGITAAGRDASDVDGRSLTALMADMDYVLKNGVESASLALLALDSRRRYDIPENTSRLTNQRDDKRRTRQLIRPGCEKQFRYMEQGRRFGQHGYRADGSGSAGTGSTAAQTEGSGLRQKKL